MRGYLVSEPLPNSSQTFTAWHCSAHLFLLRGKKQTVVKNPAATTHSQFFYGWNAKNDAYGVHISLVSRWCHSGLVCYVALACSVLERKCLQKLLMVENCVCCRHFLVGHTVIYCAMVLLGAEN